jgi:hypothetical protein
MLSKVLLDPIDETVYGNGGGGAQMTLAGRLLEAQAKDQVNPPSVVFHGGPANGDVYANPVVVSMN